jgi:hypothetical protein
VRLLFPALAFAESAEIDYDQDECQSPHTDTLELNKVKAPAPKK